MTHPNHDQHLLTSFQFYSDAEHLNIHKFFTDNISFKDGYSPVHDFSKIHLATEEALKPFKSRLVHSDFIPLKEIILQHLQLLEWNLDKDCRYDDVEYNLVSRIWEAFRESDKILKINNKQKFSLESIVQNIIAANIQTIQNFSTFLEKTDLDYQQQPSSRIDIFKVIDKHQIYDTKKELTIAKVLIYHTYEHLCAIESFNVYKDIKNIYEQGMLLRDNDASTPIFLHSLNQFLNSPFALFADEAYHEAGFIHSQARFKKSFKKYFEK